MRNSIFAFQVNSLQIRKLSKSLKGADNLVLSYNKKQIHQTLQASASARVKHQ
jgi:hypothetical protein